VVRNCKLLRYLSSKSYINNILELGSGLKSTASIRKALVSKKKGFCLSLEGSKKWIEIVKNSIPDGEYGKILFSTVDDHGKYTHRFDKKYDLILIDGPGRLNKRQWKNINEELGKEDIWTSEGKKRGRQSIFSIDYILPAMHRDTLIMVDSRCAAVYYYLQKYGDIFDFYYWSNAFGISTVSKSLKPEHYDIIDSLRAGWLTIICYKNSGIIDKIKAKRSLSRKLVRIN